MVVNNLAKLNIMARFASRFETSVSSWAPLVDGCERWSVSRGVQAGNMAVACDFPKLTEVTGEKTIKFHLVSRKPVIPFEDRSYQHWDRLIFPIQLIRWCFFSNGFQTSKPPYPSGTGKLS